MNKFKNINSSSSSSSHNNFARATTSFAKRSVFCIGLLTLLGSVSYGLNSITVDGVTYEQVKFQKEFPLSLFIKHADGATFLKKTDLTKDQITSLVSSKAQNNDKNQSQLTQTTVDDGYSYERDSNNNITSVRTPDSVTAVVCNNFKDTPELTSVYIGNNIVKFGANNFEGEKLVKFEVSPENPHYTSENGDILSKDKTTLIRVPSGKEGKYTTPKSVKRIGPEAIRHTNKLSEIVVGEGVEEIQNSGISGRLDSLESIVISENVTKIDNDAFSGPFNALISISLPEKFQTEEEFERIGLGKNRLKLVKQKPQ